MSNSLQPHESQHARPPCPSPTPGVDPNSCLSSQWCHQAISSSGIPFSSCPQSLPASESFPMSQLFAWGGQSTGVSALASFLPKKSQANLHLQILIIHSTLFISVENNYLKKSVSCGIKKRNWIKIQSTFTGCKTFKKFLTLCSDLVGLLCGVCLVHWTEPGLW